MVKILLNVIVHKSDISIDEGGDGKDKKVSFIGVLANKPRPTVDRDGMDMLSMVVSIVGRTCFGVLDPFGS